MDNYNRARTRRFGPTIYARLTGELGKRGLRFPDTAYSGSGVESVLDGPKPDPIIALYWALLGQATHDLIRLKFVEQELASSHHDIIRDGILSAEWIKGEYESAVTFTEACDAVGIEPEMVVEKLRAVGLVPEVV